MVSFNRTVAVWTLSLFLLFSVLTPSSTAQAPDNLATPDWGDYPLLMSQFGELCTMCEAYLKCIPNPTAADAGRNETLYFFQTKTFWGQIATIWDYFAMWFDPVTSEKRPATIYRIATPDSENAVVPTEAYLSVIEDKIEIDGTWINRESGAWFAADGSTIGKCSRKGIGESMAAIAQIWPDLAAENEGGQ